MKNSKRFNNLNRILDRSVLILFFGISSYLSCIEINKNKEIQKDKEFYRKSLIKHVDYDLNGIISKNEQYRMDSLCEVLDKPSSYMPSYEDFKRGYDKIPK